MFPEQVHKSQNPTALRDANNIFLPSSQKDTTPFYRHPRFIHAAGSGSILRAWMQHSLLCGTRAITERDLNPHQNSDHPSNPLGYSPSGLFTIPHSLLWHFASRSSKTQHPAPRVCAVIADRGQRLYQCIYFFSLFSVKFFEGSSCTRATDHSMHFVGNIPCSCLSTNAKTLLPNICQSGNSRDGLGRALNEF